jgi:hypothetical protein
MLVPAATDLCSKRIGTLARITVITERRSPDRYGRGVDYSVALVERLSAFFIMLIGFKWVRPRLTPGT